MSMWASTYFTDVLPPLLAANIILNVEPSLEIDRVAFVMAPSLRIQALRIDDDLVSLEGRNALSRFDSLIFRHLTPLIKLRAVRGRVTSRVLWSNAGNVFEAFSRKLEAMNEEWIGFVHAHQLLAMPTLSGGERNPLFKPVSYVAGRSTRRVCCMRYLIAEEKVCGVCRLPQTVRSRFT